VLSLEPWDRQIGLALFESIFACTAGFTPIVTFEALSPAGQLILMLVMFFWFVITLVMIAFTKLLKQPVYYYP
jgi:tetrahydromethanopterin S-methyltransferase subunit D